MQKYNSQHDLHLKRTVSYRHDQVQVSLTTYLQCRWSVGYSSSIIISSLTYTTQLRLLVSTVITLMQRADEVAEWPVSDLFSFVCVCCFFCNGAVITALLRLGLSESEAPSFKRG